MVITVSAEPAADPLALAGFELAAPSEAPQAVSSSKAAATAPVAETG
jgi:hypothetical protein